jgi:hypothetical protein
MSETLRKQKLCPDFVKKEKNNVIIQKRG